MAIQAEIPRLDAAMTSNLWPSIARLPWHLFRIFLSFSLLLVDNTILLVAASLSYLCSKTNCREAALQDVRFYPKTVLITGIGTPHGLALARAWDAQGHRVVGADVADLDLPVRSGGGMSRTLLAFYRLPKDHYISRLLDIIHREKVDIWIPCSPKASAIEDATARQVIESRTRCRCITFDTELTACLMHPESFRQYALEKGLPVLERYEVQSRDSIHKILHRSPIKSYGMRRMHPAVQASEVILPRRTLSKTYSEVSELQVSKDRPWILQQQSRLGEFLADLLVVRGHLHAIKVRPALARSTWGSSRLDEALVVAIDRLMQRFAMKGGARMTGHVSMRLMVDEEFDAHAVRHAIHIAGCTPGAESAENLLRDAPIPVGGYLAVLSTDPGEIFARKEILPPISAQPIPSSVVGDGLQARLLAHSPRLHPIIQAIGTLEAEIMPFICWKNPLFSPRDPLPWWWHVHIYQPLREIWLLVKHTREAGVTQ